MREGRERRGAGLSRGEARAGEIPAERWRQRSVAAEAEAGREREGAQEGGKEGGESGEEGGAAREKAGAGRRDRAAPGLRAALGSSCAGTWLAGSALASPGRAPRPAPPPRPGARSPPAPSEEGALLNN